jgi:hypothetical protein
MKLKEVDTKAGLNKAFQLAKDNQVERTAFLAGYQEGERAGFNDATDRGTNETPEEAYAYWVKYDKEGE